MRQHQRIQTRRRRLFLETLEDRRVLDGVSDLGGVAVDWPPPTLLSSDAALPAGELPAFSQFASADELKQFLIEDALTRYADLFGQETWAWGGPIWCDGVRTGDFALAALDSGPAAVEDHSTTNNQVSGVEEGDLVETDGAYLYVLDDQQLTIIDVRVPSDLAVVSTTETGGGPIAMYLAGDRLTVLSQDWYFPVVGPRPMVGFGPWEGYRRETTFHVTVLDVSDPAVPTVAGELQIEGHYMDSRVIGDSLFVVSQHGLYLPPPEPHPLPRAGDPEPGDDLPSAGDSPGRDDGRWAVDPVVGLWPDWLVPPGEEQVYETQEEYLARIADRVLDLALPNYFAADGADPAGLLTAPEDVYRPWVEGWTNLTSVTTIAVGEETPAIIASTSAPLDWAATLYVSPTNLYFASPQYNTASWGSPDTAITQFAIDAASGRVQLAATGVVPGQLLNQFAMDEFNGYLRVVTQSGWREDAETQLLVLQAADQAWDIVGRLDDLAPGEHVFAVRFAGDVGYVVTFGPSSGVWYDPLFTIDLQDPTRPALRGQLEIPGFSNYLQAIEGHYLIGLGRNADPENGRQLEPQVSLYDVADLQNPELTDRLSFATENAWSAAFSDHHAIAYYPEYHVLAVPMNSYGPIWTWWEDRVTLADGTGGAEDGTAADPGDTADGSSEDDANTEVVPDPYLDAALWVFQVEFSAIPEDPAHLQLLGQIEHRSPVSRSVRVGDVLLSIAADEVQAHPITDPDRLLDRIELPNRYWIQPVWPDPSWDETDPGTDPAGNGDEVTVEDAAPVVRVRAEAVDAAGQPITQVEVGESLTLNLYVQDLRDTPAGVSAAYVDVLSRGRSVEVSAAIDHGAAFPDNLSGTVQVGGLIDELGAATAVPVADGTEQLLASIAFTATAPGNAAFVITPADGEGHLLMLDGESGPVDPALVEFVDGGVEVVCGWQNWDMPGDVDDNGAIQPRDVLVAINALNEDGSHFLGRVREFLQQTAGAVPQFLDVNGDGYLTPLDPLLVINGVNGALDDAQDAVNDFLNGVRDLEGPVAGFVDWDALQTALDDPAAAAVLAALQLEPDRILDAARDVLAEVNVTDLLQALPDNGFQIDLPTVVSRLQQASEALGGRLSLTGLLGLANQIDDLVDGLDLDQLLPELCRDRAFEQARDAVRDRLFAGLADPQLLRDVLN